MIRDGGSKGGPAFKPGWSTVLLSRRCGSLSLLCPASTSQEAALRQKGGCYLLDSPLLKIDHRIQARNRSAVQFSRQRTEMRRDLRMLFKRFLSHDWRQNV